MWQLPVCGGVQLVAVGPAVGSSCGGLRPPSIRTVAVALRATVVASATFKKIRHPEQVPPRRDAVEGSLTIFFSRLADVQPDGLICRTVDIDFNFHDWIAGIGINTHLLRNIRSHLRPGLEAEVWTFIVIAGKFGTSPAVLKRLRKALKACWNDLLQNRCEEATNGAGQAGAPGVAPPKNKGRAPEARPLP